MRHYSQYIFFMKPFYPTINLLRGLAALMVCLFHFIGHTDYRGSLFDETSTLVQISRLGANGVFIFFVISGFVIPLSLYKSNFTLTQFHRFFSRRFVRIEIPYIASIGCVLLVGFIFSIKNKTSYSVDIEQFLLHLVYLIPFSKYEWINSVYWTLAIEMQFYIIIALLYSFILFAGKKLVFLPLLLFGALSYIIPSHSLVFHYATIFLQGIILFLIKSGKIETKLGYVMITLCVIATAFLHSASVAIFACLTVVAILVVEVNTKWTNRLGDISYSFYLIHGLVGGHILYACSALFPNFYVRLFLVAIAILVSLFCAFLFWKFIENPAKKISKKVKLNPLKR